MTNREFSDSFTTLLNSYNTQAQFGEQASKMEIVLDEYEKSVLLTQAQDIVTKSYFARGTNQQGEGLDDSTRRQVDFSSLIKVALLTPTTSDLLYDDRGVLFKMPRKVVNGVPVENSTDVLFILNEKLLVETTLNNGNPKTWTLNNYALDGQGHGTKKYYSEPRVTHIDKSHYWMIETDDTHYYEYPGSSTHHLGESEYWTIQQDKRNFPYPEYPYWTYSEYVPPRWTIDDGNQLFYTEPQWTYHAGTDTYYIIDLDPNQTHLSTNPGTAQHFAAVPRWAVYHMDNLCNTYDEEVYVSEEDDLNSYYVITGYDDEGNIQQITTEDDPGTPERFTETAENWVIDPEGENITVTSEVTESDFEFTPGQDVEWTVTDGTTTAVLPEDPTSLIIENKVSYWTTSVTGNKQFDHNPVSSHTSNPYWVDTNNQNKTNPLYKLYYIIDKPTYQENSGRLGRSEFYISSNYGSSIGPYYYRPEFTAYEDDLSYWLIDGDTTNPYFSAVTFEEHISYHNWTLTYGGRTYTFYSQPSVTQTQQATEDEYSIEISGHTYTFNTIPTIQHNPAVIYWEFTSSEDPDVLALRFYGVTAPNVTQNQSGIGKHYIIRYRNAGDGHSANDPADDPIIIYKEPAPEVENESTPEYWVLAGQTYDSEPHVTTYYGEDEYWTVNVTGSIHYNHQPVFHQYPAIPASWTVNYDGEVFYTEPVVVPHEGTDSYWTFSGIDKYYYTVAAPEVTPVDDPDPSLNYYVINNEDIHYYDSGEPAFDVSGGESLRRYKGEYIIVPISYKEYDREMSKPYAQPLKKQAWRLFQNNTLGFDFDSELIPKFNITPHGDGSNPGDVVISYRIRYVRRPRPIILEDLPNGLEIDGESQASDCELNPIVHMDILTKAVELAIATRGRMQQPNNEQRR